MEARWSGMDADAGALGSHDFTCEVRSVQNLILIILSNTLVSQPTRLSDLRVTGNFFSILSGLHSKTREAGILQSIGTVLAWAGLAHGRISPLSCLVIWRAGSSAAAWCVY